MTPTEVRLQLHRNGYHPLPNNGKAPDMLKGWQKKFDANPGEIDLWRTMWPDAINTGILCRFTPTFDIDILNADAAAAVEALVRDRFEDGGDILIRVGLPPKRAIPFRTEEPFDKIAISLIAPNGDTRQKLEFLSDGQQAIVDGIHPDINKPYAWFGKSLLDVPHDELPYIRAADAQQLINDAAELLIAEHGYKRADRGEKKGNGEDTSGERIDWASLTSKIVAGQELHDSTRDLAASYIGSGMAAAHALRQLRALMLASSTPHDERWQKRFDNLPRLVRDAEEKFGKAEAPQGVPVFDPFERYIVPEFPLHVLPPAVQNHVTSQAVVIGCDHSALAMAVLTAFSGALDHRFAVKMMRNGDWWEHPRLWTLLVGDPSRKKTPIINEVARPLERHQKDLRRDYEARLRDYEAAKKADKGTDIEKPDPPVRYVVWDSTTEKLGEILSRSDHGLLVKRDEFSGWIGGMEKYSSSRAAGADRGFWLQAFDGGPHAVDRVGRGETYIGNLSVSLIGGIQPAKLSEMCGLTSDGLLQRFLPVMMRSSALARDCDCSDDRDHYQSLVYKLIRAKHQRLSLSDDALLEMNNLRAHLHKIEQAAAGLADGLQAFVGKLPGIAGRLAVILHMAANPENPPREIGALTVGLVRTLINDFIVPHAVEFYRSTEELTNGERLRKIASWILTSDQKVIGARDLIRSVRCLRGLSVLDLHTQISPLVAGGWLEPVSRGPDNRTWTVSPTVATQFERQRQSEEERKALAMELFDHRK